MTQRLMFGPGMVCSLPGVDVTTADPDDPDQVSFSTTWPNLVRFVKAGRLRLGRAALHDLGFIPHADIFAIGPAYSTSGADTSNVSWADRVYYFRGNGSVPNDGLLSGAGSTAQLFFNMHHQVTATHISPGAPGASTPSRRTAMNDLWASYIVTNIPAVLP